MQISQSLQPLTYERQVFGINIRIMYAYFVLALLEWHHTKKVRHQHIHIYCSICTVYDMVSFASQPVETHQAAVDFTLPIFFLVWVNQETLQTSYWPFVHFSDEACHCPVVYLTDAGLLASKTEFLATSKHVLHGVTVFQLINIPC